VGRLTVLITGRLAAIDPTPAWLRTRLYAVRERDTSVLSHGPFNRPLLNFFCVLGWLTILFLPLGAIVAETEAELIEACPAGGVLHDTWPMQWELDPVPPSSYALRLGTDSKQQGTRWISLKLRMNNLAPNKH